MTTTPPDQAADAAQGESTRKSPMEIEFTLTHEDAASFALYVSDTSPRSKAMRRKLNILLAAIMLIGLASTAFAEGETLLAAVVIVALFCATFIFLNAPTLRRKYDRHMYLRALARNQQQPYPKTRLALTPEGVSQTTEHVTYLRKWSGVAGVVMTPERLFLLTDPTNALIVPRCAFKSDADFAAFAAEAERCRRQAH